MRASRRRRSRCRSRSRRSSSSRMEHERSSGAVEFAHAQLATPVTLGRLLQRWPQTLHVIAPVTVVAKQ